MSAQYKMKTQTNLLINNETEKVQTSLMINIKWQKTKPGYQSNQHGIEETQTGFLISLKRTTFKMLKQ